MEVISESLTNEAKDQLPQILMRIFAVCKADPNFPLKEQIYFVEGEVITLAKKIKKQNDLINQTIALRDDFSKRLQNIRSENFELKSRLLEELGSDV